VELLHEATGGQQQFENWIENFVISLQQEDPKLADALVQASKDYLKELDDKTI
jgi:hypothetical protein